MKIISEKKIIRGICKLATKNYSLIPRPYSQLSDVAHVEKIGKCGDN